MVTRLLLWVRPPEPLLRPHYAPCAQNKFVVDHEQEHYQSSSIRSELDVIDALLHNRVVLLAGPPLAGKTRTAYEIIKQLKDYLIVIPEKSKNTPSPEAFALLQGKPVLVLVDNLVSYMGAQVDLMQFCLKVQEQTSCSVLITCQDGDDLRTVKEATTSGFANSMTKLTYI